MTDAILECRGVRKAFGGLTAVVDFSARFERGRVTALVGPNGAGKTTLFHLIGGMLTPEGGEILYKGLRIDGLPAWRIARLGIGRLFQDVRVFKGLTTIENVRVAIRTPATENPVASIARRAWIREREREVTAAAQRWLTFVGLEGLEGVAAGDLSYGQQKLLALARVLGRGTDTLLLDEPTSGVNPQTVAALVAKIRRLAVEGSTVLLIEHNFAVVREMADKVILMDHGQIIRSGTSGEVLGQYNEDRRTIGSRWRDRGETDAIAP